MTTTLMSDESPLWKLPAEIRQQIWEEVLGYSKMLHIRLHHDEERTGLRQHVCSKNPGNIHGIGVGRDLLFTESAYLSKLKKTSPICLNKHDSCLCDWAPKLSIGLLRTCRKIRSETVCLLYATTTFSFDRPMPLWEFGNSLSTSQKWLLQKLHLSMNFRYFTTYWDFNDFSMVLSTVASLYGLQTLHLCIDVRLRPSSRFSQQKVLATGVYSLLKSTKASATVALSGHLKNRYPVYWQSQCWFEDQQTQFADNVWYAIMQPLARISSKRTNDTDRKIKYHLWKPIEAV